MESLWHPAGTRDGGLVRSILEGETAVKKYIITGPVTIKGEVEVSGAKNAILPIMAASILSSGVSQIHQVPELNDVRVMGSILSYLGARVTHEDGVVTIDSRHVHSCEVPDDLMRKMRATIFLMGPLIGRFGEVKISQPGGCCIGPRPIHWHLKGLRALGVDFRECHGFIKGQASSLKGADIHLDFPSVGATENIMMGAVKAKGRTLIRNAAREPEIVDLQNFLNGMGARIRGAGTDVIKVEGVESLSSLEYTVIPDRIETGTFMVAAAITGGHLCLKNVIPEHVEALTAKLLELGVLVSHTSEEIQVQGKYPLNGVEIKTLPYPGFPTDMQPQFMSLLSLAKGTSIITENVFENRMKHTEELNRMGARIRVEGRTAIVTGVKGLTGAHVEASDLRAGAALILSGLAAEGETILNHITHIERGYCQIEKKLNSIGACVRLVKKKKSG